MVSTVSLMFSFISWTADWKILQPFSPSRQSVFHFCGGVRWLNFCQESQMKRGGRGGRRKRFFFVFSFSLSSVLFSQISAIFGGCEMEVARLLSARRQNAPPFARRFHLGYITYYIGPVRSTRLFWVFVPSHEEGRGATFLDACRKFPPKLIS